MRLNLVAKLAFLAILLSGAGAEIIKFDELITKPAGIAKDYYIYRLLKSGKYTKEQASALNDEISRHSGVLQKLLNQILPPKPQAKGECSGIKLSEILNASKECQANLASISRALKLSPQTRAKIIENIKDTHPKRAESLRGLNEPAPSIFYAQNGYAASFLALFNALSGEAKTAEFEKEYPSEFMNALYLQNGFKAMASAITTQQIMPTFRQNLLKIDPSITAKDSAFILGVNALSLNKKELALEFFKRAAASFELASARDNALFWVYKISKDESVLQALANSKDLNLYSLIAKEQLNAEPFEIIVPNPEKEQADDFNPKDPFLWQQIKSSAKNLSKDELEKLANKFYANNSLGAYVYFMQRAKGWDKNYFAMPKNAELNGLEAQKLALIYALARQESNFISSSISTSYALGMMQFMPFLANDIARDKLKIKDFDQDEMFDDTQAFRFAKVHIDYLQKYLLHPLFIAYAYNGGIGFTRRMLAKEHMFKAGEFEPYLSMELVPYAESRIYGKKVLANYMIYSHLIGSSIKSEALLQSLIAH